MWSYGQGEVQHLQNTSMTCFVVGYCEATWMGELQMGSVQQPLFPYSLRVGEARNRVCVVGIKAFTTAKKGRKHYIATIELLIQGLTMVKRYNL